MALDAVTKSAPMPAPPERQYSFTDWQVAHPTEPPPGDRLDAEFDRANDAVGDTITWASVSLNTDGTLRDGSVDEGTLQPGLFDSISDGIIADVQPLVDQAQAYANSALNSKTDAESAAADAETQNAAAQMAAGTAVSSATNALTASHAAQDYANAAGASAGDADDSANHAAGDAALAEDWGLVSQAWAEHMPDTIPPNILAVMGITGDHWSSRWWAHKAAGAFGAMSELYLGALPTPPTSTSTGEPIPTGAIYYNTANQTTYVWDGAEWQPLTQPGKGVVSSLVYRATAGQTVFDTHTPDIAGTTYAMQPTTPVEVYVNGVRAIPNMPVGQGDYSVDTTASTVTFVSGLLAGTMVQIDVMIATSDLVPTPGGVMTVALLDFNIDPATSNPGQIDGTRKTFPLAQASTGHATVTVTRAAEVFVVLDGVPQQPDSDYTVSGSNITFSEAPLVGADAWALWYSPAALVPASTYLPLTGGTVTGALTVNGPTTVGGSLGVTGNTTLAGGTLNGTYAGTPTFSGSSVSFTGNVSLAASSTAGWQATGGAFASLDVIGTGTLNGRLKAKGSGAINLVNDNGALVQTQDNTGGTAPANYLIFGNNSTNNAALISTGGTDTNRSIRLTPGGVGSVLTNNTLQITPNKALSGGYVATQSGLVVNSIYSGSSIRAGMLPYNQIAVVTDTAIIPSGSAAALDIETNLNAGLRGSRCALWTNVSQTGGTGNTPANGLNPFYNSIVANFILSKNEGGTGLDASTSWGQTCGLGVQGSLAAGATNWTTIEGVEINTGVATGASVFQHAALNIVHFAGHAVQGVIDHAIGFGDQEGAAPWKVLIGVVNGGLSQYPLDPEGTVFRMGLGGSYWTHPSTARFGFDIRLTGFPTFNTTRAGGAFLSNGFAVDGVGAVQIGTGYLTPGLTGLAVDVKGIVGTGTPTIANGGSGYAVNDVIYDAWGGVYTVTAGSGGVVTGIAVYADANGNQRRPIYPDGTPPANPVVTTTWAAGSGSGLTLNLAWNTTAKALSLQPSGGAVRVAAAAGTLGFYNTTPVAKQTVSGSRGGNAALASLLTALASYGLVTDSTTA